MKKIITLLFIISIHTAWADTISRIQKNQEIRIGVDVGYQPFEMRTKSGAIIGFDVDIMKELAKSLKVKLKIVDIEWDSIIPALLKDKVDMIMGGMTVTPLRNLQVIFTNPYLHIGQTAVVRKELKKQIKTFKDLNHKKYKICSRMGTTGEKAALKYLPRARYFGFQDRESGIMEVIFGRKDAFIYDFPYNEIFTRTKGQKKVFHLKTPITKEALAWAIKKEDTHFLNLLNNFIMTIKASGFLSESFDKWFNDVSWSSQIQ